MSLDLLASALPTIGALLGPLQNPIASSPVPSISRYGAGQPGMPPQMAAGGIAGMPGPRVLNGPALAGEAGPEAVMPLSKDPNTINEADLDRVDALIALLNHQVATRRKMLRDAQKGGIGGMMGRYKVPQVPQVPPVVPNPGVPNQ